MYGPIESRAASAAAPCGDARRRRSEEHTSELQSQSNLVCRLLLEKKKKIVIRCTIEIQILNEWLLQQHISLLGVIVCIDAVASVVDEQLTAMLTLVTRRMCRCAGC